MNKKGQQINPIPVNNTGGVMIHGTFLYKFATRICKMLYLAEPIFLLHSIVEPSTANFMTWVVSRYLM